MSERAIFRTLSTHMQNVFDAWGSGHGSLFAIVCKNLFTLVPMCKILNVHTHVKCVQCACRCCCGTFFCNSHKRTFALIFTFFCKQPPAAAPACTSCTYADMQNFTHSYFCTHFHNFLQINSIRQSYSSNSLIWIGILNIRCYKVAEHDFRCAAATCRSLFC